MCLCAPDLAIDWRTSEASAIVTLGLFVPSCSCKEKNLALCISGRSLLFSRSFLNKFIGSSPVFLHSPNKPVG